MIDAEVSRCRLTGNGGIKHPTNRDAIESSAFDGPCCAAHFSGEQKDRPLAYLMQ
jgi:hypothetical protein